MADVTLAWVIFVRYLVQTELTEADGPESMFMDAEDVTVSYQVALDAAMRQITNMEAAIGPCPFRAQVEAVFTFYREERLAIFHGRQESFSQYPDPLPWE